MRTRTKAGAFLGNTVTKGENGNTVVAEQAVSPERTKLMSEGVGKPGMQILHEITEAFEGGLISQKSGVSSPAANETGSAYEEAHSRATDDIKINVHYYDSNNNLLDPPEDGGKPANFKRREFYIIGKKGKEIPILSY